MKTINGGGNESKKLSDRPALAVPSPGGEGQGEGEC